jgi:hypothetical protein
MQPLPHHSLRQRDSQTFILVMMIIVMGKSEFDAYLHQSTYEPNFI